MIVSHSHFDHTGGMYLFPQAKFYMSREDLRCAFWPDPFCAMFFRRQNLERTRGFDWNPISSDLDLFGDGTIQILRTPGHTDGELSMLPRLPSHSFVLTADADLGVTELVTAYGMTEVAGASVMTLPEDPLEVVAATVGRPKPSGAAGIPELGGLVGEYPIVDSLTSTETPLGMAGELVSRGPTTMLGYWNRPEETATVLKEGWMHSGDLGRAGAGGSLGDHRPLEGGLQEWPGIGDAQGDRGVSDRPTQISQAYGVGVPHDRWGEAGCAFVVAEPEAIVDVEALFAICRNQLARFKVPRYIFLLDADEIPQTATGKVQKFRLVPMAQARLGSEVVS